MTLEGSLLIPYLDLLGRVLRIVFKQTVVAL